MSAIEIPAQITNGTLPDLAASKLAKTIAQFDGKRVVISIKEQKRRRSLNQNAYMWSVVIRMITEAFQEAGNAVDDEDVFSFMKAHVWKLNRVFVTPDGEVLRGPGSTRLWTTQDMEVRLEEARAWAAQALGVAIPLPNEGLT